MLTSFQFLFLSLSPLCAEQILTDLEKDVTNDFQKPPQELISIDNGSIKVGIDRAAGASITWLSWQGYRKNSVNEADPGRLIQQSYYAGVPLDRTKDGQHKAWSPWSWNPIQGGGVGSWAKVTRFERIHDDTLYAQTIPKLWDMPDEDAEATMQQWTSFEPNLTHTVVVKCLFEAKRKDNDRWGPSRINPQEVPALLFHSQFRPLPKLPRQQRVAGRGSETWSTLGPSTPSPLGHGLL